MMKPNYPIDSEDTELSPHFTLGEVFGSHQAELAAICNFPMYRRDYDLVIGRARELANAVLDPARPHFPKPLITHCGYRPPALNEFVGGVPADPAAHKRGSQHLYGEAVDFHVKDALLLVSFYWLLRDSGLPFDQLIYEGTWIHVSHRADAENRREGLTRKESGGYSSTS